MKITDALKAISVATIFTSAALHAAEDLSAGIYQIELESEIARNIFDYLPAGGGLNPVFISEKQTDPNLHLVKEGAISVTFLDEGAGFKNSFGYFTFDAAGNVLERVKIFDNASEVGGGGDLRPGDTVDLGTFPVGTNIGFWLEANGFNLDHQGMMYYTIDSMNPDKLRHLAIIEDPVTLDLIVGIEDLYNLGDEDYNDMVFMVNATPNDAIDRSAIPDPSDFIVTADSRELAANIPTSGSTLDAPIQLHEDAGLGGSVLERVLVLEALRQEAIDRDGESKLVFGVALDEAFAGTEQSDAQGVAVASVSLTVTTSDGGTQQLDGYSTMTQSLLAATGQTAEERSVYYTLIGGNDSNVVTGSVFRDEFHSTLVVPVPEDMDLSNALAVTLNIELLATNTDLGDPEQFYDFSGGVERLALLNDADARYLDNVAKGVITNGNRLATEDPIPSGAPMVINLRDQDYPYVDWQGYPASSTYYMVGYEDLFPTMGDYDFNDLTVAYRVEAGLDQNSDVAMLRGEAILITRGAEYTHDWHLRFGIGRSSGQIYEALYIPDAEGIPQLSGEATSRSFTNATQIDLRGFSDTKAIFPAPEGCKFTNTECDTFITGPKYFFTVLFDNPMALAELSPAPFDPYIFVRDTGYEIHLVDQTLAKQRNNMGYESTSNKDNTFTDENGFPFGMILASPWEPPIEGWSMEVSYPDFTPYVESSGGNKKDWYQRPDKAKVHGAEKFKWRW